MFNLHKALAALALSALTFGVAANASAACTTDTCTGTLDMIYAAPSDSLIYIDPAGSTSALTCTDPAGKYVQTPVSTDTTRATYQLLLAAFLAGKSVTIKLPASGTCVIQYVTVEP